MHVLSVIHYPIYGGPHNRNAALIPVLAEHGVQTTVLLPNAPGNARSLLHEQGVEAIAMPLSRLRAVGDPRIHLQLVRNFRSEVGRIRRLIRDLDVDLVLVNGLVNPHSAVAGRLEGKPVVWQLLDTFAPWPVRAAMMPGVTRLADVIMSTGQAVADGHPSASSFGERLVFFYPVVDTKRFVNGAEIRRAARRRLGLDEADMVVGNIGNLNPMKGHETFVRAAARLRERRPNTRFVILGASSDRHSEYLTGLWQTASELGLELGRDLIVVDPGIDVAGTAPAFDIFWLTSTPRSEGIPTVIGEAMSLELPVVASDVGSVAEAVDGTSGTLVRPLDPGALAQATLPYLDDPQLREVTGRAGRERAARLFSAIQCAECHKRAFALADDHRRGVRR